MKIRFDFVTNSSSSSFVVFDIKSPELADICEKYGIPARITGDVLRDRWSSEDIVNLSRPSNGGIASWFIDLLNEDFIDLYHSEADIKGAVTEIKTKEKQINQNIGYATIEFADVCSDGGGSDYCCYEKKNGKIRVMGIDEDEWDYDKEGEALWEALSGDLSKVKKRANKNGFIIDELDLYWQHDSEGEPHEIKAPKKSKPKKTESSSKSTKKTTSNKGENKTNSKPSDKNKQLSIEQIKESVLTEVFETIVDEFDESDDVKQSVKEHFYHNFYGCVFLLLFFQFGVNESELDAQELTDIIRSEDFCSVLGVTMIEIGIVTQIESLVNELLESEDEDDVAKTLLSSALMTAVAEKELYIEFANNLEKVFSELSTSMDAMRNQFDKFEQLIEETVSDILDATDEEDDDVAEDEDDFDSAAAEQAKAEIVDSLEEIKNSLEALGQQAQAMAEEARQREQAEIDEATKRGKYIPIEFKPNNIFPEGFAELLEQGKPYPKYYEHDFETLVRRVKEIMGSDISDVPEDVLRPNDDWWSTDTTQSNAEHIMKLWNNYLLSLKGVETDFGVWQIESWGFSDCDKIDALLFELDEKFLLNGFVSEDEDFEIDAKGLLKKYNGTASNIVIPEGVVQFASGKFYNTNKKISNVTSLTLPSTLKKIDIQSELPFQKLRSLSRVDVSADNEVFSSVNGVLLNKAGTELLYYPIAKRDKEYTLPKTVIKVLPNVFTKNRYVEKIIVLGNVVEIGEGAFSNCINLKSVIFENGVKTIAKNAFKGCSFLEEIFIPESMEKFLMTSFQKCEALKVIYVPEGSRVMVNAEKMATKFGAELVKYKAGETVADVMKKAKSINSTPTIHVAINTAENNVTSAQIVKQSVEVKAKPIATQEKEGNINNDLVLKDKANKRIKELEEQIKSNEDKYSFGPILIIGGLFLIAIFLYLVFDEYNAYQVTAAFYNDPSSDSLTIALVLFVIASMVGVVTIVSGFVKIGKKKKLKAMNSQLQKEIELLNDPKNYSSYFNRNNLDNKENIVTTKEPNKFVKFIKTIFIILVVIAVAMAILVVFGEILTIVASIGFLLCWFIFGSGRRR